MAWAILDTDVYIAYWERGLFEREMSLRRDFQNDSLIALTARRHGATVVTANRADFTRLAPALRISLLVPPTQRAGK